MTTYRRRPKSARLKAELALIKTIKSEDPFAGISVQVGPADHYRIRILARGEQAYFEQNSRALLVEMDARSNTIFRKSIRWWDTGERVTDEEAQLVLQRLADYLTSPRDPPVTICDR